MKLLGIGNWVVVIVALGSAVLSAGNTHTGMLHTGYLGTMETIATLLVPGRVVIVSIVPLP